MAEHTPAGKKFAIIDAESDGVRKKWERCGELPDDPVAPRTALFSELRRWRHIDTAPPPVVKAQHCYAGPVPRL